MFTIVFFALILIRIVNQPKDIGGTIVLTMVWIGLLWLIDWLFRD